VPISPKRHERLTDEQLREWRDRYPEQPYAEQWSGKALIDELLVLRARVAQLEAALQEPSYDLVMKIESKLRELAIRDQQDVRVFATELANIAIEAASKSS
jgi:hypothetical protein